MERTGKQLPERQRERCAWQESQRDVRAKALQATGVLTYTKRKTLEKETATKSVRAGVRKRTVL